MDLFGVAFRVLAPDGSIVRDCSEVGFQSLSQDRAPFSDGRSE